MNSFIAAIPIVLIALLVNTLRAPLQSKQSFNMWQEGSDITNRQRYSRDESIQLTSVKEKKLDADMAYCERKCGSVVLLISMSLVVFSWNGVLWYSVQLLPSFWGGHSRCHPKDHCKWKGHLWKYGTVLLRWTIGEELQLLRGCAYPERVTE